MFKWAHNRKMNKIISSAEEYVAEHYQETSRKSDSVMVSREMMDHAFEVYERMMRKKENRKKETTEPVELPRTERTIRFSLSDNYDDELIGSSIRASALTQTFHSAKKALDEYADMSFVDKMKEYIRTKNLRDVDVYKAAQIDRRLYSKLVSDHTYKPSKDTCVAIALALKLSMDQAKDLLTRAGYALSHSSKRDLAIEYCFADRIYDVNDVNELLYNLDLKTIGR